MVTLSEGIKLGRFARTGTRRVASYNGQRLKKKNSPSFSRASKPLIGFRELAEVRDLLHLIGQSLSFIVSLHDAGDRGRRLRATNSAISKCEANFEAVITWMVLAIMPEMMGNGYESRRKFLMRELGFLCFL